MKKVLGIIGPVAAGKDTAAEYIISKENIPVFQISQPLKEIAMSRNIIPTRENLIVLGRELSLEKGSAYLAEILLSRIMDKGIITGMRQVAQIEYLRMNADFLLLAIDAPPELRFERAKTRGKLGEGKTLEQFIENEQKENNTSVQRLFDCMELADYTIINDGDSKKFTEALQIFLKNSNFR